MAIELTFNLVSIVLLIFGAIISTILLILNVWAVITWEWNRLRSGASASQAPIPVAPAVPPMEYEETPRRSPYGSAVRSRSRY